LFSIKVVTHTLHLLLKTVVLLYIAKNHLSPSAFQNPYFPYSLENHLSSSYKNHCFPIDTKTFLKFTLSSAKDISLLTGKHSWGPWHTAIWTLIDCSNLLGHIHKTMLPGALYNPDLELPYPTIITHELLQSQKDSYSEWWNHDKVATYILTSHLSPHILDTISIVLSSGSRMDDSGLRRRIPKGLGLSLYAVPS
jgi:hypothetical protein